MANIPVNFGGVILSGGQSATGSFAGLTVFGTEALELSTMRGAEITIKYGTGIDASGQVIQSPSFTTIVPPGATIPLFITSCSLSGTSAPVILYT